MNVYFSHTDTWLAASPQTKPWGMRLHAFAHQQLPAAARGIGDLRLLCLDMLTRTGAGTGTYEDFIPANMDVVEYVAHGRITYRSPQWSEPVSVEAGQWLRVHSGAHLAVTMDVQQTDTVRWRFGWQSREVNSKPQAPLVTSQPPTGYVSACSPHEVEQASGTPFVWLRIPFNTDTPSVWVGHVPELHDIHMTTQAQWLRLSASPQP